MAVVTFAEKQRQLTEGLGFIQDRQERLSAVVERAQRAPGLPPAERLPGNRVPGCVSPVWVVAEFREGRLRLRSDAESPVVRGLVALLCELYDGVTPEEALNCEPEVLDTLELTRDLSPTRRHGLAAIRTRIREMARVMATATPSLEPQPGSAP